MSQKNTRQGSKGKRTSSAAAAAASSKESITDQLDSLASATVEAFPAQNSNTRKRNKATSLEQQVKQLEEENLALRLQLKVGKETTKHDEQKKDDIVTRIETILNSSGNEDELRGLLKSYVVRYSDCSADHAETVDNHMMLIQRLLAPTKVTKLCLWALNQDEEFFKPVLVPRESLFYILSEACDATIDQAEEFKNYRHNAKILTRGLRFSDRECEDLKQRLKRKNRALAEEMHELQDILSPQQLAKFIIWVNRDKDLHEVLKQEWVGWSDPQEEEERRDRQHRERMRDRNFSHSGADDEEEEDD